MVSPRQMLQLAMLGGQQDSQVGLVPQGYTGNPQIDDQIGQIYQGVVQNRQSASPIRSILAGLGGAGLGYSFLGDEPIKGALLGSLAGAIPSILGNRQNAARQQQGALQQKAILDQYLKGLQTKGAEQDLEKGRYEIGNEEFKVNARSPKNIADIQSERDRITGNAARLLDALVSGGDPNKMGGPGFLQEGLNFNEKNLILPPELRSAFGLDKLPTYAQIVKDAEAIKTGRANRENILNTYNLGLQRLEETKRSNKARENRTATYQDAQLDLGRQRLEQEADKIKTQKTEAAEKMKQQKENRFIQQKIQAEQSNIDNALKKIKTYQSLMKKASDAEKIPIQNNINTLLGNIQTHQANINYYSQSAQAQAAANQPAMAQLAKQAASGAFGGGKTTSKVPDARNKGTKTGQPLQIPASVLKMLED